MTGLLGMGAGWGQKSGKPGEDPVPMPAPDSQEKSKPGEEPVPMPSPDSQKKSKPGEDPVPMPGPELKKPESRERITVEQPAVLNGKESEQKGRALMQEMVTALGGDAWLNRRNWLVEGRTATFFKNNPTGVAPFWNYHLAVGTTGGGVDRVEFTKKRDVVQIWTATKGYELTFKGKKELPAEITEDYFRRQRHSIEEIALVWMKDPQTLVIYGGTSVVERRIADKVTLIDSTNDSVIVDLDSTTHLPVRRKFEWRNALYKDRDEDVEEYDDYHPVQGLPTPFTVSRYKNGDLVSQRFITKRQYNMELAPVLFDPDQPYNAKKK